MQPNATLRNWKTQFFLIWIVQALSWVGSSLVHFALIWWLTETTGSATVLATAATIGMLPGIFLGPIAGACVDRWNRRTVLMAADGLVALATLILALIHNAGWMQPWHIYAVLFVRSCAGSFHWPAMQASTSLMVPKEQLARVAGMNQTLQGVTNIITPPLGAVLLGILPLYGILGIDVVTAILAITPILINLVHIPQPEAQPVAATEAKPTLWRDMADGLRYVCGWTGLMIVMVIAALINLVLNPAFALMPLLVTKHFGGDALQLGWLNSAFGIGVLLGGLTLSAWGGFKRRVNTSTLGLVGMGLGTLVVGLTPSSEFSVALGGMFLVGCMNPLPNGPLFAILQSTVEPNMQGRVFTLIGSASSAASPLGMIAAGPLADALGVPIWYVVGGIVTLMLGASMLTIPALRTMEDHHSQASAATAGPVVLAEATVTVE